MTNTNESPYRYLGNTVTHLSDRDEILAAGGADFNVSLKPVAAVMGSDPFGRPSLSGADDFRAVVTDDGEVLHIAKGRYTPVQYGDVFDIARDAVALDQNGSYVDTLGTMKGRKQFFCSIVLDRIALDPQGVNDLLDVRLNVLSSHDGTLGIVLATGVERLICCNQSTVINRKARTRFAARHTTNASERLALAASALKMAREDAGIIKQEAEKLLRVPSSEEKVLRVIEKLWGKEGDLEGRGATIAENRRQAILSIYRSDTCVGAVGHNSWAAYGAFTEYLDHARIQGGKNPGERLARGAILGAKDDLKTRVGELLLTS